MNTWCWDWCPFYVTRTSVMQRLVMLLDNMNLCVCLCMAIRKALLFQRLVQVGVGSVNPWPPGPRLKNTEETNHTSISGCWIRTDEKRWSLGWSIRIGWVGQQFEVTRVNSLFKWWQVGDKNLDSTFFGTKSPQKSISNADMELAEHWVLVWGQHLSCRPQHRTGSSENPPNWWWCHGDRL